jgi:hypothetical protein
LQALSAPDDRERLEGRSPLARLLLPPGDWRKSATERGMKMMYRSRDLMEELGEPAGMSRSAIALCCAIIEDAEVAREFEMEPRGVAELLRTVVLGSGYATAEQLPFPRELTKLIS